MATVEGIEPPLTDLETAALPLRYTVILGAGEETRTLDINLGKVALYQLSYSRINLV